MTPFFSLQRPPHSGLSLDEQRRRWLGQFLKSFFVVFVVYLCMYLVRNNFKAAQPLLKEQYGLSTLELGYIGLAFSITYGIGKTLLGYLIDGRNTKKIISFLLVLASLTVLGLGITLSVFGSHVGIFVALWGLNGLFQSAGGPGSYSTITSWTPREQRGRYLGFWNASHNIGGALAGVIALWGANMFFGGNVIGMFVFPALIGIAIGVAGMFIGKNDSQELGWNTSEEIFGEPVEVRNVASADMSKFAIFKKYIMLNPWIWLLCVANVFTYIIRIGIDNWAPLYVTETLNFSTEAAVNTIFFFEIGAFFASMSWGYISDLAGGRRALVAVIAMLGLFLAIGFYQSAESTLQVNSSLFILGALIFGPQLLIGISLVGFVPKKAISVANGMTGTFGYLFGDSIAKVGLAMVADPERDGLEIFGHLLHGWGAMFTVLYASLVIGIAIMVIVALGEERQIRRLRADDELARTATPH
ncbi:hexose-6-phosphate:phosphate antiporter [Corynebacterium gerontici]|uniref:Hexose phosphate transport protein n=1 Tax=Corynebacterium gerontici TaxID=2079234 RepID=A0A3G6J346_9CORY|nr:hexose-6-phosphate:phosphate antiporter [Corynebacterium gerontici]AZA10830.1 Hexose phosphate transport protein [Corynebacterium gerontici]